jgi:hypothetical protein
MLIMLTVYFHNTSKPGYYVWRGAGGCGAALPLCHGKAGTGRVIPFAILLPFQTRAALATPARQ